MLFNWVILLFSWFNRKKPIVNISISTESGQYQIIKPNFKTKRIPLTGEVLYLKSEGPYYVVTKIIHYIGIRHIIWVVVNPLILNELPTENEKV